MVSERRDIRMRGHRLYVWRLRRSPLRREFHTRIASHVESSFRGGWTVDVGCGPGLLDARIAPMLHGARLVGVDIDPRMLRIAKSERGLEVVRATASALPFRDGSVGLAVSSASLKDWGDRGAGLTEILRIVRPGGAGLVYDFLTAGPGSEPAGFARRFGIVSDVLRRLSRFAVRFTFQDANQLAEGFRRIADASVRMESDLGVVCITLRKPSPSAAGAGR